MDALAAQPLGADDVKITIYLIGLRFAQYGGLQLIPGRYKSK